MAARVAMAMPVYNDERYLRRALDALCLSTFTDFHLTIVDDGSTDGSAALAASYEGRLPLTVVRAPHRGLQQTKRAAAMATDPESPFFMALDADVVLPPDALGRMVHFLEADDRAGVVSGEPRAPADRPWGKAQAFLDDLFYGVSAGKGDEGRWISGNCCMFRREALIGATLRVDMMEDVGLAEQLRQRWRILAPRDLVVLHLGVADSLRGIYRQAYRQGLRLAANLRNYPNSWQWGTLGRLVPLPLCAAAAAGVVSLNPLLVTSAGLLLAGYVGAFLVISAPVRGPLSTRLSAAFVFTYSNVAYGVGFLREAAFGKQGQPLREPPRL